MQAPKQKSTFNGNAWKFDNLLVSTKYDRKIVDGVFCIWKILQPENSNNNKKTKKRLSWVQANAKIRNKRLSWRKNNKDKIKKTIKLSLGSHNQVYLFFTFDYMSRLVGIFPSTSCFIVRFSYFLYICMVSRRDH